MSMMKFICPILFLGVFVVGCDTKESVTNSGGVPSDGGKYILTTEPADPQTPTEIKESITEPTLVAITGRIHAGDVEPFQDGVASFLISQLPEGDHAEDDPDHADNCPFCKRKLKNAPKALVRILDDSGEVMTVDARKLLGIAKGDVVVVRGSATFLEPVNTVQVDAEGIFVR
ncbi:MAG TPA: hypothetical protein DEF45_00730 [Rhodopirellula sp.]|nr:MAG: hypothetical protein CBD74_00690 [Saprospirales bacterium TMED214]HBV61523.1 hypothetical protein [Rhodopirellula sp.]